MRKLLSRVDDVFQIADRGCVVVPGIPRNSESRVKIGDRLWLLRPDGSEISTVVRGIEMGGPLDSPGIPILLGTELSKNEVPVGTKMSIELTPAETLTLHARSTSAPVNLDRVFQGDDTGHVRFGWSGKSQCIATTTDIQNELVEFTDYLMEGFVTYHMRAIIDAQQLTIIVELHGTNRDQYMRSHVVFHLEQAGLVMVT